MKRIVFIAAGLAALASGCASNPQVASVDDDVDYQKVAAINNVARARGVSIHWLSFPQRHATPTDVAPSLGEPTGT